MVYISVAQFLRFLKDHSVSVCKLSYKGRTVSFGSFNIFRNQTHGFQIWVNFFFLLVLGFVISVLVMILTPPTRTTKLILETTLELPRMVNLHFKNQNQNHRIRTKQHWFIRVLCSSSF
jgi:hypothetical protein